MSVMTTRIHTVLAGALGVAPWYVYTTSVYITYDYQYAVQPCQLYV